MPKLDVLILALSKLVLLLVLLIGMGAIAAIVVAATIKFIGA